MPSRKRLSLILAAVAVFSLSAPSWAQLTSPKAEFGFEIGDDYQLVNYTRLAAWWKKLDRQSERMSLVEFGRSSEGRPMIMAVITAPKNFAKLARYKDISRRLALGQGLTDAAARQHAAEGKAVVWIDGGLHASEIVGSQTIAELVWQMVSGKDAETLRLLDEVILLAVPVNPDGLELVADWYMREPDPKKRTMSGLPRLYQKYIGHDNNRDYYMVTQKETEAVSRQLYIEWHPQFLYNQHQTGPSGTVLFCPPFRDPFNYTFDPLIPIGTDLLGLAMHERFAAEGKPGAIMRGGAGYSTWWNGGLRSTGYFHNIIGILTEIIGNPTPMTIPFIPDRMLPRGDYPYPIMPQAWHFRRSIDYSITACKAILDFAARRREEILWNRYVMAKNAIAKGNTDTWTFQPRTIAGLRDRIDKERAAQTGQAAAPPAGQRGGQRGGVDVKYFEALRDPAKRDPRGFIIPSDQPDFPTAVKFVNTLMKSGVIVHRAVKPFTVAGKTYPQGSFVVKSAQAFRSHLLTMFEPQDHPDDFPYPGGPPRPPYDSAGWTVAFQMGIAFDRILDGFDGPFEALPGLVKPPAVALGGAPEKAAGFILDHRLNDVFILTNRLMKAGRDVFWMKQPLRAGGKLFSPGAVYIPNDAAALPILEKAARELGLVFTAVDLAPVGEAYKLKPVRIGLWDTYGGSMPSGWAQWILEQFEFPYEVVYAPALDAGNLKSKFDVLVFVGGAVPTFVASGDAEETMFRQFAPQPQQNIPDEFKHMIGRVTAEKTIPELRTFVEAGGTILAIGSSTAIGYHFKLPITNHLVEKTADGREVPLRSEKLYAPGSVLRVRVDNAHPLAYGMEERTDIFYNNSPVFSLRPEAPLKDVRPVAWFEDENPLRSGWVWGDVYLRRGTEVVEAQVGMGKVFLCAPEILFRGQPHGTFKFLFNGIYYGPSDSISLK
ncbi:MAG: peptidase [Candidatus Aminicenantes bacterium]|nr:peptidase [Candidatus Aminicenantes bacterium]